MAKVQIKSEKITPFGGIFHVRELFSRFVDPVIDKVLGLRCTSYGYQYSEIAGSLSSVFFCGGDCVEDVTSHLMPHLSLHPTLRTCSSDTILRGISELSCANTTYTSETGKIYDSNAATKLNSLLALRGWQHEEINGIEYELNSIITEKWEGKAYRLVIQRERRMDGEQDLWEGEYTYRCILTNDYTSTNREIVEFYNLRGGTQPDQALHHVGNVVALVVFLFDSVRQLDLQRILVSRVESHKQPVQLGLHRLFFETDNFLGIFYRIVFTFITFAGHIYRKPTGTSS